MYWLGLLPRLQIPSMHVYADQQKRRWHVGGRTLAEARRLTSSFLHGRGNHWDTTDRSRAGQSQTPWTLFPLASVVHCSLRVCNPDGFMAIEAYGRVAGQGRSVPTGVQARGPPLLLQAGAMV